MQSLSRPKFYHKRHTSHASTSFLKEVQLSQLPNLINPKSLEENTSSNSTQSGNSSPHLRLECEETLEGMNIPMQTNNRNADTSMGSLIDELNGLCLPSFDCESLETEEISMIPTTLWQPKDIDYMLEMLGKEKNYMPNAYCFDALQPCITPLMRAVLFDWMMEVMSEYMLRRETLYLAMSFIDRVLSNCSKIKKEDFQLIGVTCMDLASKLEEIYPPKISD